VFAIRASCIQVDHLGCKRVLRKHPSQGNATCELMME
jgi:hypothetical protein